MEEALQGTALEIAEYLKAKSAEKKSLKEELTDLFLSLLVFLMLGQAFYSGSGILGLVLVIFIHEAGHFLGMRAFGYREARIRFVPLLGAYTAGRESNPNTAQRALTILLGPCPGILLGFTLWVASKMSGNDGLRQLATIFLFLNGFNLLPLIPLDGGRVVEDLLFSRHSKLQVWFQWLMFWGLVFLAVWFRSIPMGILAFFVYVQNHATAPINRLSEDIKDWDPPDPEVAALEYPPPRYLKQIVDKIEHEPWAYDLEGKKDIIQIKARYVEGIWQRMRNQYPSGKTTAVLLGGYLMFLLCALPVLRIQFLSSH